MTLPQPDYPMALAVPDPETLDEVGHYLPAMHFALNIAGDTVSTDFSKLK